MSHFSSKKWLNLRSKFHLIVFIFFNKIILLTILINNFLFLDIDKAFICMYAFSWLFLTYNLWLLQSFYWSLALNRSFFATNDLLWLIDLRLIIKFSLTSYLTFSLNTFFGYAIYFFYFDHRVSLVLNLLLSFRFIIPWWLNLGKIAYHTFNKTLI